MHILEVVVRVLAAAVICLNIEGRGEIRGPITFCRVIPSKLKLSPVVSH